MGGGGGDLVWCMLQIHRIKQSGIQQEVIAIPESTQHCPRGLQAPTLDEERMQEEEASERQPCTVHTLQPRKT